MPIMIMPIIIMPIIIMLIITEPNSITAITMPNDNAANNVLFMRLSMIPTCRH